MHERTQRAMARLMFVLCCALPTLMTLSVIVFTWTPWYHHRCLAQIEAKLSDETGLLVEIDDFDRATPSTLQLKGVRILAPETGREVVTVRQVTWAAKHDEIVFVLRQPEMQSSQLEHVWALIHDRFLCRPDQTQFPVSVVATDLTIHSETGPLTLRDINAHVQPQARATVANIVCWPAEALQRSPMNIFVTRDRRAETPTTRWTLETRNTALPCSALAECFPVLESFGEEAMFQGVISYAQKADGGTTLDLGASRFTNIELSRLFDKLPHKLTGEADVHLTRCLLVDGQAVDVSGQFYASEGLVGGPLLRSISENLGLLVHRSIMSGADEGSLVREVAYDRLAVGILVQMSHLELIGICNREPNWQHLPERTVLRVGSDSLVQTQRNHVVRAMQLLRAISPDHGVLVPAAQQTSVLARLLKAPSRPSTYTQGESEPRVISVVPHSGGESIKQR